MRRVVSRAGTSVAAGRWSGFYAVACHHQSGGPLLRCAPELPVDRERRCAAQDCRRLAIPTGREGRGRRNQREKIL